MIILIQWLFRVIITITLGSMILLISVLCSLLLWNSDFIDHAVKICQLILFGDE